MDHFEFCFASISLEVSIIMYREKGSFYSNQMMFLIAAPVSTMFYEK